MDRRQFLAGAPAALLAVGAVASWTSRGQARTGAPGLARTGDGFSLDLVTDDPDRGVARIEALLEAVPLSAATVRFHEARLAGTHTADLAWVGATGLLDYRDAGGDLGQHLRAVAADLGLPRPVTDPTLLRVEGGARRGGAPRVAEVYAGEVLVDRLPLHNDVRVRRVEGPRGFVDLTVRDGTVRVVDASCRHRTCVDMGPVRRAGQSLVCIPAGLRVTLTGTAASGAVDAVAS